MYNILTVERNPKPRGSVARTCFRLAAAGTPVGRLTVAKWAKTWSKDGNWKYTTKHQQRSGRPLKLSPAGCTAATASLLGSRARETSRKRKFESMSGEMVTVSRTLITSLGRKAGYQISVPKRVRIRVHFPHHLVFRISHCRAGLTRDEVFRSGLWYSDEQSYSITLNFNSKNDVEWVVHGTQSTTNRHRHSKGDESKSFNLWWVISPQGVVVYHMYENSMDVDYFHEMMTTYLMPARIRSDATSQPMTSFYHDHVTNSSSLYDVPFMDKVCGKGRWLQFAPAVCREFRGRMIQVEATSRARAYERKQSDACLECECDDGFPQMLVPSASPELNLAENAQAELLRRLNEHLRDTETRWLGSPKKKMVMLEKIINDLDADKQYWHNLYGSLRRRWQRVVNTGGDLLKN